MFQLVDNHDDCICYVTQPYYIPQEDKNGCNIRQIIEFLRIMPFQSCLMHKHIDPVENPCTRCRNEVINDIITKCIEDPCYRIFVRALPIAKND